MCYIRRKQTSFLGIVCSKFVVNVQQFIFENRLTNKRSICARTCLHMELYIHRQMALKARKGKSLMPSLKVFELNYVVAK